MFLLQKKWLLLNDVERETQDVNLLLLSAGVVTFSHNQALAWYSNFNINQLSQAGLGKEKGFQENLIRIIGAYGAIVKLFR